MNKVILIGRLTRDPELRFAPNTGNAVVRFTLAVNRRKQKDKDQEADFIHCVAFGKTAETIAQYLLKGNQIAVEGNIRTGSYDKDGIKRYTTDVIIERFNFIGNNKSDNSNQTDNFKEFDDDMTPVDDGDMPF
ncbi:single-stranded DNA-binding protein [Clostridium sp. Ade.TY]|uniref:single-stranded DNA-binding protein n=1 Tax=Clostridium sp. Ade.TY TaxID=1391647 RepID=UPI0004287AA9|nr:single-stranded DNA-binding protein [Clostridium sp. Ade.TY]